jgi:hypothetical protein
MSAAIHHGARSARRSNPRRSQESPAATAGNRAEYLFSHVDELTSIGVVGLLFGATHKDATNPIDDMADGITNPPSLCSTDGLSLGVICPTETSQYADDVGGYLRTAAGACYRSPVAVSAVA